MIQSRWIALRDSLETHSKGGGGTLRPYCVQGAVRLVLNVQERSKEVGFTTFFNTLFPDTGRSSDQGYVVLAVYPENEVNPEGIFTSVGSEGPTQLHFFSWPSQRDHLISFCLSNGHRDIYTSAALYKKPGDRSADNIKKQWAVIADADTLPLHKLKAEPTLIVQTSPGRHHLYWVTNCSDVKRVTQVSKAVAHTHAADGCDKGGWDAGQLLRVPGTTNNKYHQRDGSPGVEVRTTKESSRFDINKIEDLYPPVDAPTVTTHSDMPPRSEWHNTPGVLKEAKIIFSESPYISDEFHRRYTADELAVLDRSEKMWRFLGELARCGVTRKTAMYLAWEAPFCKYRLDQHRGRTEEEMWNELCRAYDDPQNQPVTNSLEAAERVRLDQSDTNPEHRARQIINQAHLLEPGERILVPSDTLVDQYAEWAKTCTDAPGVYHRSGALCLLTSVFGEFGRCPLKRDANLTLWFMILGPTTRARKTTAMNLWVDLLVDLQDSRYSYLRGSDFTSEALNVLLPKYDGRTSVFWRDEAHGMFAEQDRKNYMAGQRERMTDLYGGRVPIALRVSTLPGPEDETPSIKVRTNFVLFLAGTMEQIAEVLTIKDYQSGHLARFILADAEPPPMTEEGMYTEQYDGSDDQYDGLRHSLLNAFYAARDFWQEVTPPGSLKIIPFENDAWKRLQRAQWQLYSPTIGHEMQKVMEATAKRMGDSMMKVAVLLAMSDKCRKVSMKHVYKAMELAEEWYANSVGVAGRIMHSSWSAQQEEILAMIRSKGDGVTEQEIFARFRHRMQKKDIDSNLEVIVKAGLADRFNIQGRTRYVRSRNARRA